MASIPEFVNARVVKSNPDTPQHMVGVGREGGERERVS